MRKQWIPGPFLSPREKGLGTRLRLQLSLKVFNEPKSWPREKQARLDPLSSASVEYELITVEAEVSIIQLASAHQLRRPHPLRLRKTRN